jgi:hypothetical protein
MKKLFLVALLCAALPTFAQRHITGTAGLEIDAGFLDRFKVKKEDKAGFFGSIALSKFTQAGNYWKYGYTHTLRYYKPVPDLNLVNVQQYVGDVSYYGDILSNRGSDVYVNLGGGASVGYERINNGVRTVAPGISLTQDNKFLYGAFIGLDTEFYLSDHFVLLARAAQRWYPSSDVSNWNFNAGIGVKFIIVTR